jgi:anti-anti-sigma factor
LCGRLDAEGVDQIETQFTASVVPGHRNVIVDLSDVTFVSSGGLKLFIIVAKVLRQRDVKLVLFAAQPQVSEIFAIAALSSIVPLALDEAEALGLVRA